MNKIANMNNRDLQRERMAELEMDERDFMRPLPYVIDGRNEDAQRCECGRYICEC